MSKSITHYHKIKESKKRNAYSYVYLVLISMFCAFLMNLLLVGCNSTKSEIDKNYRSGVVLIVNQYYYTLTLSNGEMLYFADDGHGEIAHFETEPDSAINCLTICTGTGFFISEDGKIATNKHVVDREVSDKSAVQAVKQILNNIKRYLEDENDEYEELKELCRIKYNGSSDPYERVQLALLFDEINEQIKENNQTLRELGYIDPDDAVIEYHSDLRIAYNGTFVNSFDDMYSCTLREVSEQQDVAIIQLNSKTTPTDKFVFSVPEKNMLEHYSFGEYLSRMFGSEKNDELYMIGFNKGFSMANTEEGISSQCTEGTISQMQKEIIQYNISSEGGSSGSPVLNRRGQLVAINFAGFKNTKNFNYGVKEKFLYDLIQSE